MKKKTEHFQKKELITAPWEAIQNFLLKNMCHQKMYTTNTLLVDDYDKVK